MSYSVSIKKQLALLLLVVFVSVGCSQVETVTIKPASVAQDCTSKHHDSSEAWCISLPSSGLACEGPEGGVAANSLKVFTDPLTPPQSGWGDSYDSGTGPLACPWWVSTFSRAYVKFNLNNIVLSGQAVGIDYASLSWTTHRIHGGSSNACIKYIYEAGGPWSLGNTPTLLFNNLDTTAVNAGFIGVVDSAKKWWANPDVNWGFIIEPSRNYTEQYSDSECLEALENLSMTVKFRVNPIKWPSP